jgi:hypothetical protein
MDGAFCAEAVVERVRVLQPVDAEELERILQQLHFSRLTSSNDGGQWVARESIMALGRHLLGSSHAALWTCSVA